MKQTFLCISVTSGIYLAGALVISAAQITARKLQCNKTEKLAQAKASLTSKQ